MDGKFNKFIQHIPSHYFFLLSLLSCCRATVIRWLGRMNGTAARLDPAPERGEPIDPRTFEMEGEMLRAMLNTSHYPGGLR